MTVDQTVKDLSVMTKPSGSFTLNPEGRTRGSIDWSVYSSSGEGFQLSIRTDGTPALESSKVAIPDFSTEPKTWAVGATERAFGFSANGQRSLDLYQDGTQFRGFEGTKPITIARYHGGPADNTETELILVSEFGTRIPNGSNPTVLIAGTVTVNL